MPANRTTRSQSIFSGPQPEGKYQNNWRDRIKPDWPVPQIQNVVATCDMGCRVNLPVLAAQARNVEFNRKKFHALVMRIREPRTTTLVFASGKMVVTGAKSEALALLAARKHTRAVQKCGFPTRFRDFKVQNFVGSATCDFLIRLERIAYLYKESAMYEPELFPGLVYTMVRPKLKCLVFSTGKVVLTGAKSAEDVHEAFTNLYPLLLEAKVAGSCAPPPRIRTRLAPEVKVERRATRAEQRQPVKDYSTANGNGRVASIR
ncbi:transcription factor TFIID-domain-containing protein [Chaetomium sp. MPI-CAGE-AT-0009]|nr:transcription factor TFIID-domain-containing protein [Chaetomium sp. MPI-CAGE-AT-0009]